MEYNKNISLLGGGRSTNALIKFLVENLEIYNWHLNICEKDINIVRNKIQNCNNIDLVSFDVNNTEQLDEIVSKSDIVISMVPALFHSLVLKSCIKNRTNMVTASYLTGEIKDMENEINKAGIMVLNEIGVDPGIDHLSAMKIIDRLKSEECFIHTFESFTGGLVAPKYDNNPWNYKFTWNPRNVVLAGQGSPVKFIQENAFKYIPYHKVFRRTEMINIDGYGRFEGYANRDSLKYIDVYGLSGIPTIYRGTLRRPGFCRAWDVFVQLGATDDSYIIEDSERMTYREFINSFLAWNPFDSVELKLMQYLHIDQDSEIMEKLKWLGIFENTPIGIKRATPAQILEHILLKKWTPEPTDKDMIVMWHKLLYKEKSSDETLSLISTMVTEGDNAEQTAMAKTVGLPLGIAVKLILTGEIKLKGLHIPVIKEIYNPILKELKNYGIEFHESCSIHDYREQNK